MATEDLTGTKYIDDLVETNPTGSDFRWDGDDHVRGVKNTLKLTFPNLNGPVNATPAEINLMAGLTALPEGLESGTIAVFDQASAPTGWTQDTTTSNLTGSTVRIETGTGGGAVGGTHNLESAPSLDHTHADTFSAAAATITASQMRQHNHMMFIGSDSSDSTPDITTTYGIHQRNTDSNNTNYNYDMAGAAVNPTVGRSTSAGSGTSHTHSFSGSITAQNAINEFRPYYFTVILCEKD